MSSRRAAWLVALVVTACTAGSTSTTAGTVASDTSESTSTSASSPATLPPGDDLLTFARGVLLVSSSGIDGNDGVLYQLIDGDDEPVTITTTSTGRVEMVFKMPVATVFERFALTPVADPRPGASFDGSVLVEGSIEGPDSGFETLSALEVSAGGETQVAPSLTERPVRWLRVTLVGVESGGQARGRVVLAEILGQGTQEDQETSDAFNGVWDLRLASRPNAVGERLELIQDGTLVTGCLDTLEIRGTVNGSVVTGTGTEQPPAGRSAAVVFVADDDGAITATVAYENGRFETRTAHPPPRETEPQCALPETESAVCDTPLYVNFAYDSADIRTESGAVLDDIYRILVDLGVTTLTVQGHTSTEGTEDHNQELSEARAEAVAGELVARGFPEGGITTVGFGETQPLVSPDDDEASRAVNRRVELECG